MYMSKWNKSLFIPEAGQISKNILLAPVPDFVDVPCLLLRWSAVLMCVCVCVCVVWSGLLPRSGDVAPAQRSAGQTG